ncbi:protein MALE DISCOVERER 1 isoform X1 [Typha latifolia]|uniref:protein MALE DISCOVERER 1 isoform X1 n=1 Tax=Typha latifolia TaxID=4733 RepID=UPI003C2F4F1E
MGRRWWCRVLWVILMVQLQADEFFSLNLEGLALLEFRAKVEIDPYGAFANWDSRDSDPCGWSGVHCIDGKVEMLNLTGLGLGGKLANGIGKLSHLRSLVLYKNNFYGAIPKEIGGLTMLELLDLSSNNLDGTIPVELGEMHSLKYLLLCDNKFRGATSSVKMQECNRSFYHDEATRVRCVNRKVDCWFKSKMGSSSGGNKGKYGANLPSFIQPYTVGNPQETWSFVHRKLLQEANNLPALSGSSGIHLIPVEAVEVPSTGSGSFPAVPNSKHQLSTTSMPTNLIPGSTSIPNFHPLSSKPQNHQPTLIEKLGKWLVIPAAVLLLSLAAGTLLICHGRGQATIGPWKTGLSCQLQKALITGVPKLNRSELEAACEDFSNIINSYPEFIVFKGTLSSGVEIAVVSTIVASAKDWSNRAEMRFRKKIETLSSVNHKNFINLLGYCEEDEPFMRMMVFEYAPNGTLFEHLHVKGSEHLDWVARMRIIMGTAYCLQYMQHELNPPVELTDLCSNVILMADDYAAKIADISIWKEAVTKQNLSGDDDFDPSETPSVDSLSNIYNFGILMLEIISGKLPYSEEQGSLLNWATEYLNDKRNIRNLVDPTLKNYKSTELEIICEVIQECIHSDPKHRPTMKEITTKLRQVLAISPDAANPRLSPLWWAELEILSVEAS